MWCLETIIELNEKVDQGMTPSEAYKACGIVSKTETFSPTNKNLVTSGDSSNSEKKSKAK